MKLIANMAANSQYSGGRNRSSGSSQQKKEIKEVDMSKLEQQVANLTSLVEQVVIGKGQAKVCGLCSTLVHPIEDSHMQQRKYDP